MRKLTFLAILSLGIGYNSNAIYLNTNHNAWADYIDGIEQDRSEGAFNFMMTELARVHKAVFDLPYEKSYIKTNFMSQIEAQRLIIAPHYPSRADVGDNEELVIAAFKAWYQSYPKESSDYIAYVDQFIANHD